MLKELLKLHFVPSAKLLLKLSFVFTLLLSVGIYFKIEAMAVMGGMLIFGSYLYSSIVMQKSYQKNLYWNLMIPTKRWNLFFSFGTSSLALCATWFISFLTYFAIFSLIFNFSSVVEVLGKVTFNLSSIIKGFGVIFSKIPSVISEMTNFDIGSLFTLSFTYFLLFIFFLYNIGSMKGLIEWRDFKTRMRSNGWSKKQRSIFAGVSLIALNMIFPSLERTPFLVYGLILTLASVFFFYLSYYALMLPKRSFWKYMASGTIIGVVLTFAVYKIALYQIGNSSPNLVIQAYSDLGDLAPGVESYKDNPYKHFIDYSVRSSVKAEIPLETRLGVLSFIDKAKITEQISVIYKENMKYLLKKHFKDEAFVSTVDAINIENSITLNPSLVSRYIQSLNILQRDESSILFALNNLKIYSSDYEDILAYFLGLNSMNVSENFFETLLGSPQEYFNKKLSKQKQKISIEDKRKMKNWDIKYSLAVHLLRYGQMENYKDRLNSDKEYFQKLLKMKQFSKSKVFKRLVSQISLNQKIHSVFDEAQSEVIRETSSIDEGITQQINCQKIAPKLVNGSLGNEKIINHCYRKLYSNASGRLKYRLEKVGWVSLNTFKKHYAKLRDPVVDYLFDENRLPASDL